MGKQAETVMNNTADIIIVRGGGDIATGTIQKLWRAGFYVAVLEQECPLTIRRTVALSSAVQYGTFKVEDMEAVLATSTDQFFAMWEKGIIPVFVDPTAKCIGQLKPIGVVDAIIAKRNTGMFREMAPITIGLGPGFSAPEDVDCVVETKRGHFLGHIITNGPALPNTGVPGKIGGKTFERVVHAPISGTVSHVHSIGHRVKKDEIIFMLDETPILSPLDGTLRGLIASGIYVEKGLKCADVDPREEHEVDCFTVSDKARSVGGGVLEACFMIARQKGILLRPIRK